MSADAPATMEIASPGGGSATSYRTHTCGELRAADVGREVRLAGAVDKVLGDAELDLRDAHGVTRVQLSRAALDGLRLQLPPLAPGGAPPSQPTPETILLVEGTVDRRSKPSAKRPTGEVKLRAQRAELLSPAKAPLIYDFRDDALPRAERIRHRYVYLRKPAVHAAFAFRTRLALELRRALGERGFEEIDTPVLASAWTSAQEEAFLAIRERGQIFALPGPRAIHGAVIAASGFDRAFELGRRFRRKPAYGPFEQPEYTVLDAQMAYATERDLYAIEDALFARAFGALLDLDLPAVVDVTEDEALARFGTATPDVRYALDLVDATALARGSPLDALRDGLAAEGAIFAFAVRRGARQLDALEQALAALGGAAGAGGGQRAVDLAWAPVEKGAAAKLAARGRGLLDTTTAYDLGAKVESVVVFVRAAAREDALAFAARARAAAASALRLDRGFGWARVRALRYARFDAAAKRWRLAGDPVVRPVEGDLEDDPRRMRMQAHRLVLNGVEVGGGATMNHDPRHLRRVFDALSLDPAEVDERYGRLFSVLRFGAPSWARLTLGFDRLTALLLGLGSIDEVIPLPKMPDGSDPLARSPWPIDNGTVRGLLGL